MEDTLTQQQAQVAAEPGNSGQPPIYGVYPAQPISTTTNRTTRAPYMPLYGKYPVVVPHRAFDPSLQQYLNAVAASPDQAFVSWAAVIPLRLLQFLGEGGHELVTDARHVWTRLAFGPENTTFHAVDATGNKNDAGTDAIRALIDSLTLEVGGLEGLQITLADQGLFMGMACMECVPSEDFDGLTDLVTFDPTTIRYRDNSEGERWLEQQQRGIWRSLNRFTALCIPLDGSRDNPYGVPLFAAALPQALADITRTQNLNDVLRTTAWPRLSVGFPFDRVVEQAKQNPSLLKGRRPDGGDWTPAEYATGLFNDLLELMGDMKADDTFVYPEGGMVKVLDAASGLAGLQVPLEQLRLKLCQSVHTLPSLLGITDGGTQAYSSVNWGVQAKKIESFRSWVNSVLCRAFKLHLQLLGMPFSVVAESEPIRSSDAYTDEQARQLRIANEQELVRLGYQDRTTASIRLTGTEPVVSDEQQKAIDAQNTVPQPTDPNNPAKSTDKQPVNTEN